ncbi:MAG: hypothetical protein AAGG09_15445 [Pseudomonadota bacterium]
MRTPTENGSEQLGPRDFTDETLMAYADGVLDDETARAVQAAARSNPSVAERIAAFRRTGDALSITKEARALPPVPEALTARVREVLAASEASGPEAQTLPFARPAPAVTRWAPTAVAASLALAVGLGAGLLLRAPDRVSTSPDLVLSEVPPEVSAVLSRLPSGDSAPVSSGAVTLIASFRSEIGEFCREFELSTGSKTTIAIACDAVSSWDLRFAVATGRVDDESYVPAGALEALDAWLSASGAGAPLTVEAERDALDGLGG